MVEYRIIFLNIPLLAAFEEENTLLLFDLEFVVGEFGIGEFGILEELFVTLVDLKLSELIILVAEFILSMFSLHN